MLDDSRAPWTAEEVANLNEFQNAGYMHPFTCGSEDCRAVLVATPEGWTCPAGCGYTQDWAHDFMANGEATKSFREQCERHGMKPRGPRQQ